MSTRIAGQFLHSTWINLTTAAAADIKIIRIQETAKQGYNTIAKTILKRIVLVIVAKAIGSIPLTTWTNTSCRLFHHPNGITTTTATEFKSKSRIISGRQ
jgi:hypothetical protein